jgi:predicted dehydrogenase
MPRRALISFAGSALVARRAHPTPTERIRLGVIGCGAHASAVLLPHLRRRPDVELLEVAAATPLSALNAKARFGFMRTSGDYQSLLAEPDVDAVVIATRPDSHAAIVCAALHAGKAAYVEAPLALTAEELGAVQSALVESGNDRLMVGFGRRFARLPGALRAAWGGFGGPQAVSYTVNAGPLVPGSWRTRTDLYGTRFTGAGGHFIDAISWWLGADPVSAQAVATPDDPDNLLVQLAYPDGSIARIAHLTAGDARYPGEVLEAFGDGKVARLEDLRRAELWQGGRRRKLRAAQDLGVHAALGAFVRAVRTGGAMPVPLASLIATTACTLAVGRSIASGRGEPVAGWERLADQEALADESCYELRAAQ